MLKTTSLSGYMLTSTFNTKSAELENKIKDADIIAKSAVTKANAVKSDLTDYAKKTDVATDITAIKNDYVTNASLTSRLNDLKSQNKFRYGSCIRNNNNFTIFNRQRTNEC